MKRTLAILLTLVLMTSAVPMGLFTVTASAATSGYYTYTVSNGEATITRVSTSISGAVTIPSTLGGYPVRSIGDYAFYYCYNLTSITIPDSVTSIGARAFEGCSSLKSITVDKNNKVYHSDGNCLIETSSKTLIAGCKNSVIPSDGSVTSIGDYAFTGCYELTTITVPDSVMSIGSSAFYRCSSLKTVYYGGTEAQWNAIKIDSNNELLLNAEIVFNPIDKVIYTISNGEVTITGCDTSIAGALIIPSTIEGYPVTSIGYEAFDSCSSLTSITIPDSVIRIGNGVFPRCTSLESITVNKNNKVYHSDGNCLIETRSKTLIAGCKNSVIPSDGSVTNIGNSAFFRCSALTSITIPDSVTRIGNSAFYRCSSLTSIVISDRVTEIGDWAFYYCSSLTSITIPNSVMYIGYNAFYSCSSLTSITIPDSVTSIGGSAFYNCSSLTSITIPDGVTSIGDYAFYGCTSLTSITIPDSVTSIGNWAFECCDNLKTVYYGGTEAQWKAISIGGYNAPLTSVKMHFLLTFAESDVNGDNALNADDAIYLLYNSLYGDEEYPISAKFDLDRDGAVDTSDAIYLLYHILFGKDYPLYS